MYLLSVPCAAGNSVQTQGGLGCAGLCCAGGCGLGLFDSGMDFSGWGVAEYAVLAAGLYVAFSVFSTTKRGVAAVRALPRQRRRSKAARLRAQAKELSKA